jgi:hypothetical protein
MDFSRAEWRLTTAIGKSTSASRLQDLGITGLLCLVLCDGRSPAQNQAECSAPVLAALSSGRKLLGCMEAGYR